MKWFKHESTANMDAKLQEVLLDYGLEGYGLYWYCLELVAGKVEPGNLTFELEHDCRIIARNTGSTPQRVQEMMTKFVDIGLFENSQGTITCLKMARVSDDYTAKLIRSDNPAKKPQVIENKGVLESPTKSEKDPLEENRLEENRTENNNTDFASSDDGGQCDLIPEDKETSKPEKPKKPRLKKSDNWKQFYAEYPANRRGGSDATPWEKAKKMRLTEDDFAAMLEDVKKRKLTESWRNGFVPGITKYLTEETWKVPLTWPNASYQTNQNNTKVDVDAAMSPRAVRRQESTPEQLKRNQEQAANLLNMFKEG